MPSKRLRKKRKRAAEKLNITSMMDMFTIILVFLLKSYSSDGQLITPAQGLEIPESKTELSAQLALEIQVGQSQISVDGIPVADIKNLIGKKEMLIPELVEQLKKEKESAELLAKSQGKEFKGKLVIHGDKKMPYEILTKVMYSCGQVGYSEQNFVVYKNN